MIGAGLGGWLQDIWGRRVTLGLGGLLSIAAILMCYLSDLATSPNPAFFGGKMFEGVAVGMIICSTQTYLSEVVPTRLRAPVMALFPLVQMLGQLIASLVTLGLMEVPGQLSYRLAVALQWPFSAIPLVLAIFIPESPSYLLQKDRYSQALASFERLYGRQGSYENNAIFENMALTVKEEKQTKRNGKQPSYMEALRGTDLRRTLIAMFAVLLPELFGMHLLGNASYFLQQLDLSATVGMAVTVVGVLIGMFANVASFWTTARFGRRALILSTLGVVTLLWLAVGISGFITGSGVAWFTVVCLILVISIAGVGVWPVAYVVSSESSSLRLRSKTQGLTWIGGGLIKAGFDLGIPYAYNPDSANLRGKTGFIFCGTALIGVIVTWFFVPEMKGRTPVEIDRLFELKIAAWRFQDVNFGEYADSAEEPFRAMEYGGQLTELTLVPSRDSDTSMDAHKPPARPSSPFLRH
jgi:MFS family permease